ncbi:MAG: arylsulfatase [Pseudomonadota bacterium]
MIGVLVLSVSAGVYSVAGVAGVAGSNAGSSSQEPNLLLIVADDLGYADLGSFGSTIRTPNIDAFAAEGIRFTRFQTAPMCAPSRAMLLSGHNNHVAGVARQSSVSLGGHPYPGYEGGLSDRVSPFPKRLRDAGYRTYSVGKWQLGMSAEFSPTAAGFVRSYNLLNGSASHWDSTGMYEGGTSYWSDGDFTEYPEGRYSTELYTDKLLDFFEADKGSDRPFFAYVAYTAPHWPLQVPEKERQRYAGQYDGGYDDLRQDNFRRLQATGIVPVGSRLPPRNPSIPPWDTLNEQERRRESRKMELYAAMVENLDGHVGRLVRYLKKTNQYQNTLIVFLSDNGASGTDFYNGGPFRDYIRAHYDNSFEKMGTPESFVSYGPPWAEAGSAPFARYKGYTYEGGITAPFIIAGPDIDRSGDIDAEFFSIMDVAPTLLDAAGLMTGSSADHAPMLGESMLPYLSGSSASIHSKDYVTALYHSGRAFLRQGKWKLATLEPPFDERKFALFDLASDPGETRDLKSIHPDKFKELIELWRERRRTLGILLPEDL